MSKRMILSASEGKILELLVVTPGRFKDAERCRQSFDALHGDLCQKMVPETIVYWAFERQAHFELVPFNLHGVEVRPLPIRLPLGCSMSGHARWIQDPFISVVTESEIELVVPTQASQLDWLILRELALATGRVLRPVDLPLEGGNLLAINHHLLVGKDFWGKEKPGKAAAKIITDKLKQLTGASSIVPIGMRKPLVLNHLKIRPFGGEFQPFFHIDLFILPGGQYANGKYLLFLGEVTPEWTIGLKPEQDEDLHRIAAGLEEVGQQLLALNSPEIELRRLPLPISIHNNQVTIYSFCNGFVEENDGRRIGWLPYFKVARGRKLLADLLGRAGRAARKRLEMEMISTKFVKADFASKTGEGGALHCSVKILKRKT